MWPGFKSRRRGIWVEFVVGSLLSSERPFSGYSGTPQKLIFPNSNSTRNQVDEEPLCGCATSKSLFTYLLFRMPTKRFLKFHSNSHITLSFLFIWNWNGKYLHTLPLFHRKPFPFSRPKRRKNHTLWDGTRHSLWLIKGSIPVTPAEGNLEPAVF